MNFRGLGRRLIQEVVAASGFYLAVEMPPVTKRIYDKLQYVPLNPVSVYAKIIKLDRASLSGFVSKWSGTRPWLGVLHRRLSQVGFCYSILASTFNLCLGARELLSVKAKRDEDIKIQEMDGFGVWVDELPPNSQTISLGNMMLRDRSFLKWRYESTPHLEYEVFIVSRRDRIVGYSVLRKSDPVEQDFGFIVDLVVPVEGPNVLEEVLRHAIAHFRGRTACIQCSWPLTRFKDSFKKIGFLEMRKSIPFTYCTDAALLDKLKASRESWFITRGDSDWDQLYPVTRE